MKSIKLTLLLLLFVYPALSGDRVNSEHWLKISWANDIFFQSDKYFTNGFNFEYYSTNIGISFINYLHLPDQSIGNSYYGFGLKQNLFTPADFHHKKQLTNDRPFASYLVFTSNKIQTNNLTKLITKSEIEVGLIGQQSGGQWLQNSIHSILPASSFVPGWENQIQTDVILNYGIELEKGLLYNQNISLSGYLVGKLGSLHTYGGTGLRFRAGDIQNYFEYTDLSRTLDFQAYFFAGFGGKYVLYNATIQGGLFNKTDYLNHPDISSFVYDIESGINLSFKNINMEIGTKYLSPEFLSGSNHFWGYISIMIGL